MRSERTGHAAVYTRRLNELEESGLLSDNIDNTLSLFGKRDAQGYPIMRLCLVEGVTLVSTHSPGPPRV